MNQPVKPDDHSDLVPLLPIPNRTVKRASADDSADSRVKVGHRQAIIEANPRYRKIVGVLLCVDGKLLVQSDALNRYH